jgi:hypothetical protein
MTGPQQHAVRIYIYFKYCTTHTDLDMYQWTLFNTNRRVGDFSEASHWCERNDLMKAAKVRPSEAVPSCFRE